MNTKLYLYECNECSKNCTQIIRDSPDTVENTISGYNDINDCDYYYTLQGEYKENN